MTILRPPRPVRKRWLVALAAISMLVPLAALPAAGDHTETPDRVTVMGSLMDELGCATEWDVECMLTDMTPGPDGLWTLTADVPAGSYEYKVRMNGSWDESYGLDGGPDNIPLILAGDATLVFTYDHDSHLVTVAPAAAPEPVNAGDEALAADSLREDLTRERFYFVMADRFANGDPSNDTGGFVVPDGTPESEARYVHGYDPTDTAYFHGGDLQGLIDQLDYIEGLGTTAIWLTPSFKNKPVQGVGDSRAAGYHGYWITDYTSIDPHLGSNDDMRALVDAAHDRGIKVFFDIITNHTADVITYDRSAYSPEGELRYVPKEDAPYLTADGEPFDDADYAGGDSFPEVDLDSFPYPPIVPADEADLKIPSWLNDPIYYHNRGTSTFSGESDTYGDFPSGPFSALDDLWTEHPRVVEGMIDIYTTWVGDVGIDGFRIDTVKHVNIEFWQQFSAGLLAYADSIGNDDFFMFGEVFDGNPAFVSRYTTEGTLQAAADFGFQGSAARFARGGEANRLQGFFAADDYYTDADSNVYSLPTFLGNHDMGRIGSFLVADGISESEALARDELAHALMFLTRGQPVVYYGDEQGFNAPPDVPGGIGDQRAREDMFPSQTALYNSYDLLGTDATTAEANFDTGHPLYQRIAELSDLVERHPTLADGAQIHRHADETAGVYAFSRIAPDDGHEYIVALNNDTADHSAVVSTWSANAPVELLWSSADVNTRGRTPQVGRNGEFSIEVPALSATVWRVRRPIVRGADGPTVTAAGPVAAGAVAGRAEIAADVEADTFTQVTFAWRPVGTGEWQLLGTDDNAPFRVFHDVSAMELGSLVEYRMIAHDHAGRLAVAQAHATVVAPAVPGGGGGSDGVVVQPDRVTTPGTFQDQLGCENEWDPPCQNIDLVLDDEDLVWSATFAIPAGSYAYKVAINGSWDENYGAAGVRDGPNITLEADGDPITFWYSHATNWVTNSVETPNLFTVPGNFQSELGCPGDWQPDCMRSWLQDRDGDGIWTFRTRLIPAGDYEAKVAQDLSWDVNWGEGGVPDGPNIGFSVADGQGVEFSFDGETKVLSITNYTPDD